MRDGGHAYRLWADVRPEERATYGAIAAIGMGGTWAAEEPPGNQYPLDCEGRRGRGSCTPGSPECCRAAVQYYGSGLWYPCLHRGLFDGFCWTHKKGLIGMPSPTVRRRVTTEEEVVESEVATAEIRVPLGELTVGDLRIAAAKIVKAAEAANAGPDARVLLDHYMGVCEATVQWEIE